MTQHRAKKTEKTPAARAFNQRARKIEFDFFEAAPLDDVLRARVTEAARLLLQSATGRRLARRAINAGYDVLLQEDARIAGGADHARRLILLDPALPVRHMTLTLAHELAHVSQKIGSGLDIDLLGDHPLQSIETLMAMEADARAYEMRVALELSRPKNPRRAAAGMMEALVDKSGNPLLAALVEKAAALPPEKAPPEAMMAGAFKCFYADASKRAFYEGIVIDGLKSIGAETRADCNLFKKAMPPAELARRIDSHGIPYLPKDGYIDLGAEAFRTASAGTQAALGALFTPAQLARPAAAAENPVRKIR